MALIGISLALIAAVLFGLSTLGQKASLPARVELLALLRNRRWLLSLGVGLAGVACYLLALSMEPLSTVMPLIGLSLVVPVVGGAFWLKEPLHRSQWLFAFLLLAGVVLVSIA